MVRVRWLVVTLGVLAGSLALVPTAGAEVDWLCRPGLADDPCRVALDTTVRAPDGTETVESPTVAADPGIDCFYVYPTVSNQLRPTATKARDPELASIATFQAARFSQHCRVFAPIYRQSTLASILTVARGDREVGYADVLEAWRYYLEQDNAGRGVVLIAHSQGTGILRRLLRTEIEPDAGRLRRVVSAILLGGNVTVAGGRTDGGDFRRTPLCTTPAQLRCVVAYATFAADPPPDSRFGRTSTPRAGDMSTLPGGPGFEVACTDPRRLAGETGPLRILTPSRPFAPGGLGIGEILTSGGLPPRAPTTWVVTPDRYDGACRTINGATVLRVEPIGSSRRPNPFPDRTWGTHLIDVNLTYEPLVSLVGQQAERWTDPDVRLTRRCVGGGRLRVGLTGRDAEVVRAVDFKLGTRRIARAGAGRAQATIARRTLARTTVRQLRAVAELDAGPARVITQRSLPSCGIR